MYYMHKREKCEFSQKEIKFLRHIVSQFLVKMDPQKVWAIESWHAPLTVTKLRLFLGLSNFY